VPPQPPALWRPRATLPPVTDEQSPVQTSDQADGVQAAGHDEHEPTDREWTHDPLERSFFGTVGRGYVIGILVFGLFAFVMIRTQAKDWGVGAAIGAAAFVAFFAGVLGGVVLIGLWAMKNEELIRGNEAGEAGVGGWVGDPDHDDEPVTTPAEPGPAAEAEPAAEAAAAVEAEPEPAATAEAEAGTALAAETTEGPPGEAPATNAEAAPGVAGTT
jgi:hypothetical protein